MLDKAFHIRTTTSRHSRRLSGEYATYDFRPESALQVVDAYVREIRRHFHMLITEGAHIAKLKKNASLLV